MPIRDRNTDDRLGPAYHSLLNEADRFAAMPADEVMEELGLTREKAEDWQRITAELAQRVRVEQANASARHRRTRTRRTATAPPRRRNSGPID
jgi:hypothetical protein